MSLNEDIIKRYDYCKELVEKKDYRNATGSIKELIDLTEPYYLEKSKKENIRYMSFNHILETYYYAYFFKDVSKLNYTDYNISGFYRLYGFCLMKLEKNEDAIMAYNKGLDWNPVDLDTLMQLGELYKITGNIKAVRKVSNEFYKLCCTRATLARYYRNLAFYYLETHNIQMAAALYLYSNIYYETENALSELKFIESILNQPVKDYSLSELQELLKKEDIPLGPNSDTLGITYRVGQIEADAGNTTNACDCFAMVYDLTQDLEVKAQLDKLCPDNNE